MNILVVGFGNMGCRHTQSLLNSDIHVNIWVVEPDEKTFNENSVKIGASIGQLKRVDVIEELIFPFDFAIVATSAEPRFDIVKQLLKIGVKKLLLEKVVFQSELQFDEIINLLERNDAKAYCNFVNRYYPHNQKLKNNLQKHIPINMSVVGGDFGLGCNGLHYVDIFEFFTESKAILKSYSLQENPLAHKRGNNYKEVLGQIHWVTSRGDSLLISSSNTPNYIDIVVSQQSNIFILQENPQILITALFDEKVSNIEAKPIFSSSLTSIIIKHFINESIILPTVQETKNIHVQFFKVINTTLGITENHRCPIT